MRAFGQDINVDRLRREFEPEDVDSMMARDQGEEVENHPARREIDR
jgi:hypothetical protein